MLARVQISSLFGFVVLLLGSFGFGQSSSSIFLQPQTYSLAGSGFGVSVALADVNGDGQLDIVASNECPSQSGCGSVVVSLGNGDGTFRWLITYSLTIDAGSVVVADVNGDGKPELCS